ncbi:hypothetical protein M3Y96_00102900 [Aphelenchoides besseyi]|nr:hypothetical protein M3Y96_00102900 [Aphelenchoides besseyi]
MIITIRFEEFRIILRVFCFVQFFLFFIESVFGTSTVPVIDQIAEKNCTARCERLFDRSLKRVGYSFDSVTTSIRNANAQDASVICWKFLDYDDCDRQCRYVSNSPFNHQRVSLSRKCKKVTASSPYLKHFQCLHRFHTFLEVRCSSFAKEATRFRVLSKLAKDDEFAQTKLPSVAKNVSREMLIHETCRFLHYHGMCLANAVFSHCPQADDLFNRFTLRDYFLSFVVPKRDQLFTDRLLDYCQLYDFQKIARDLFDSTKSTVKRHLNEHETTPISGIFITQPHTPLPSINEDDRSTGKKSLFSSDEDLLDTPPNFFYSSAKYTKSYREALERLNYQTTNHEQTIDELDLISHKSRTLDLSKNEVDGQSQRTTIPIQKTTSPDLHPTESPDHQLWERKDERYNVNFDSGTVEETEGDYVDYIDQNGPLFHGQPHVFKIRKYDDPGEEMEYRRQGLVFGHREAVQPPPISVTVHHINENGESSETIYEEDQESVYDPNEVTFPGRRNREETTRRSRTGPPSISVGDTLHTFVTTAFHPTTPHPIGDRHATQTVMFLIIAYLAFFLIAISILMSLIIVFVVRRRQAKPYKTYLVKKHAKF